MKHNVASQSGRELVVVVVVVKRRKFLNNANFSAAILKGGSCYARAEISEIDVERFSDSCREYHLLVVGLETHQGGLLRA
jgi:hypothetical protein